MANNAKTKGEEPRILEDMSAANATTEDVADEAILPDESKADAFKRLATKRTTVALDKIRLIGNLTSANYEYSDEQAARIISALQNSLNDLARKFAKCKEKVKFEL